MTEQTAINTAVHSATTPSPSTARAPANVATAHTLSSAASDKLKPSLSGRWRWITASTMTAPTTRASTTPLGVHRNMPITSGTSLSVNECASSPISMWIASRSATAKPAASAIHEMWNGAGTVARWSRTIPK